MMSVILLILKIIGMILLLLLALILVFALLIIFLPVRYRVTGSITRELQVGLKVNVSWLLHILFFQFRQREKESRALVRIFGVPIQLFPKKEKKVKRHRKKRAGKSEKQGKEERTEESTEESTDSKIDYNTANKTANEIEQKIAVNHSENQDENVTMQAPQGQRRKRNLVDKIKQIWQKLIHKLAELKTFCNNLIKNIHHIFTRTGSIKEMILDETNRKASQLILKELLYVLGHYRPRKIKSELAFSLGDPATTGQVLGALSVLPVMYRYNVGIYPDFVTEQVYVEGAFSISGRIRMIHLIRSAIHIWRDENTKHLIGQIRA